MPTLQSIRHKLPAKRGFTLIELLVVIAIIGILATFVVASFTSAQQRGRDARRKSDLDAIKKALSLMKNDSTGSATYPITAEYPGDISNLYIRAVPLDPSTGVGYTYTGTGTCGAGWPANGCTAFNLRTLLENTADQDIAGSVARCQIGSPVANNYYVCND